jgi:hypothetical protein
MVNLLAVVIDGMTLPDASAMNMSLYDLELLEFVKDLRNFIRKKRNLELVITTKANKQE